MEPAGAGGAGGVPEGRQRVWGGAEQATGGTKRGPLRTVPAQQPHLARERH